MDEGERHLANSPPRWTRWLAGALLALQALAFGWAGLNLPWQGGSLFTAATWAVATCVAAAALSALVWPRRFSLLWWAASVATLAWFGAISVVALRGVLFLVASHGALGAGMAAALGAVWAAFAFGTLPIAVWGLVSQWAAAAPRWAKSRRLGGVLAVMSVALLADGYWRGTMTEMAPWLTDHELAEFAKQVRQTRSNRHLQGESSPFSREAATCDEVLSGAGVVLFVQVPGDDAARCIQAARREEALAAAVQYLRSEPRSGAVKLDWVGRRAPLTGVPQWVNMLALRPGLDGLCLGQRCLTPWQLVARGAFAKHRPFAFLPDLRLGSSLEAVERMAGSPQGQGGAPVRFSTQSVVIEPSGTYVPMSRLHAAPQTGTLSASALNASRAAAQHHILRAQADDGAFRYLLDPFSGKPRSHAVNLARQAGTTLALCEFGAPGAEVDEAARLALRRLAAFERTVESKDKAGFSGLARRKRAARFRLADSALALVAFLRCRARLGGEHDSTIVGLSRLLLRVQHQNGRFAPGYRRVRATGEWHRQSGPEPLYVSGQVTLALVLLEQAYPSLADRLGVPKDTVRAAIDRTMDLVASDYWDAALYPFFFLEENWHCIAAQAALESHPHAGYQQFCLDYARFKSRLILDESSRVSSAFVGGFGFGNVVPPHTTATAGFGEALAAAVIIGAKRGEKTGDLEAKLQTLVRYLVSQQWSAASSFAVAESAFGGFSESLSVGDIRIDNVQHAWAALSRGAEALGVL